MCCFFCFLFAAHSASDEIDEMTTTGMLPPTSTRRGGGAQRDLSSGGTLVLSSAAAPRAAGARPEAERQLRVAARVRGTARPKEGKARSSIGEKEDDHASHEYGVLEY